MKTKLLLSGFEEETTDVDSLYKDYGELTLVHDITNNKSLAHITGYCEDVLEMSNEDFLTMVEILNKLQ
jgi:hypothetical protein